MTPTVTIRTPDEMHVHLREGEMLKAVLPYTMQQFGRAIIMPNLRPAVTTVARAKAYRDEIMKAAGSFAFTPLMTLYLTEGTSIEEIERAKESGFIHAFKYYPRGATTNSEEGVLSFDNVIPQLSAMERAGMPLLIHGENNYAADGRTELDPFDKEKDFVQKTLPGLRERFPKLRIVLEHITTKEAAAYLRQHGGYTLGATITPHHLLFDRRFMFKEGLNVHAYCLPVMKRTADQEALVALATAGFGFVFAGTDSAPHPRHGKEVPCGCAAGCFVAPIALPMYAKAFEDAGRLDALEGFLSEHGAGWYGLPLNEGTITLVREDVPYAPDDNIRGPSPSWEPADLVRTFGVYGKPEKSLTWHWRLAA